MPTVNIPLTGSSNILDAYGLLKGRSRGTKIANNHLSWYIQQAILLEQLDDSSLDIATIHQLSLMILQGFSKVASLHLEQGRILGMQTSPLLPQVHMYHRLSEKRIFEAVHKAFAKSLGKSAEEIHLIDHASIHEVFARELAVEASYTTHKDTAILLTRDISERIRAVVGRMGFRPSHDNMKKAWLKVCDVYTILEQAGLPCATLATRGVGFPNICETFEAFVAMPIVKKFSALSDVQDTAPYLQVLPEAVYRLLHGLAAEGKKYGGIESVYRSKKIEPILQVAYYRMQNAMNEAIFRRDNLIEFCNHLELIFQEVQNILLVVEPYGPEEFATNVQERLSFGLALLEKPNVHMYASGMLALSTVLAAVEVQKGHNNIHAVLLKDCYYETTQTFLHHIRTYETTILDGDEFTDERVVWVDDKPPSKPIDLFVCEFHHNISDVRYYYAPEDILGQIKAMIRQNLVADKFTVVIDTTIGMELGEEVRAFFGDSVIQENIAQGRLNVVLVRSAQKFDMLGADNYSGGFAISINSARSFVGYNGRMDDRRGHLEGLSYQGLTHLQKFCAGSLERYRKLLMENTQKMYRMMPRALITSRGNLKKSARIRVAEITDPSLVYLDIKFSSDKVCEVYMEAILQLMQERRLPFIHRPSFGFVHSNISTVRANTFRINPGLVDEVTLRLYVSFFKEE